MENLEIENARIGFRNFAGEARQYNNAGRRNFSVFLPVDDAQKLLSDGWNVKFLKPRDEEDDPQAHIPVEVSFRNFPPKILMITKSGRRKKTTELNEDSVNVLDWAEIESVDVILRPYEWAVNGKEGVKAYLKTMYITIVEDQFAAKYEDVQETFD